tara:strand:+ start:361 stop:801 length:441 start_codon:yes stop_codon:yes gene_type:complete
MSDNPALEEGKPYKHTVMNERFCQHYAGASNGNGSEAARLAGYSENSCATIASALLKKVHIKKRIDLIEQEALDAAEITPEWVLQQLKKNAVSAQEDNPAASNGALKLIGQHAKMFVERTEVDTHMTIDVSASSDAELDRIIAANS